MNLIQTSVRTLCAVLRASRAQAAQSLLAARSVAMAAAVLFCCTAASATTKTFNNAAGGSWHTASNWTPAGVPGVADDVILPAGTGTVSITSANVTVRSLAVGRALTVGRVMNVNLVTVNAPINLLNGAELTNGTYSIGSGGQLLFPAASDYARLANVTISGNLDVAGGGIRWSNVTLNGAMNISGTSTTSIGFEGVNTIDFPISIVSTATAYFGQATAGTLTIATAGSISGGTIGFNTNWLGYAMTLINNGRITANTAGQTVTFESSVTLINNGVIDATIGTVRINGATNPVLGSFTGGNIGYAGTLDLGGGTWDLAGRTINLLNGAIQNGTVSTAGGGTIVFPLGLNVGAILTNLTINGDLNIVSTVLAWTNVRLNGALNISGSYTSQIAFYGDVIIDFPVNVVGTGTVFFTNATPGTITIAQGTTVFGRNMDFSGYYGSATTGLINNGTIVTSGSGSIGIYFGYPLINNGTIRAESTATNPIIIRSGLINNGVIDSTGGQVTIWSPINPLIGTYSGNNFVFLGTLDLQGGTWDLTGRTILLDGSALQNGTILNAGGAMLTGRGACSIARLNNLTINGDLNLAGCAIQWRNVRLNGGLNISGALRTAIGFEGNNTINFAILISGTGEVEIGQATPGTLVIPAGRSISGGTLRFNQYCFTAAMTLINNGVITAATAGQTMTFASNVTLTNNGLIDATTGSVMFNGTVNPLVGSYGGTNLIYAGTVDLGNGTWDLTGRTVSLLHLATLRNGTISTAGGGVLTFPLGYCEYNRLSNLTINGNLNVSGGGSRWSNVTINGALNISGSEITTIEFNGNTVINFPVTVRGTGTAFFNQETAGTLTIAPGTTVSGGNIRFIGNCLFNTSPVSLINNGTISCDVINQEVFIFCPLINNGTINATAGSVKIVGNANPIVGTFTGNTIFGGTIDLNGNTLFLAGRTVNLGSGSTLQNGTVSTAGGTLTFPGACDSARLANLTINGDLNVAGGCFRWSNVTLNGGLNITGTSGDTAIGFEGNNTLSFPVSITSTARVSFDQATTGTLTIPASQTIAGDSLGFNARCFSAPMALINNGAIVATTVGRGATIGSGVTLTNNGVIDSTAGSVTINGTVNPLVGTFRGTNFSYGGNVNLGGGTWDLAGRTVSLLRASTLQNGTILTAGGGLSFASNCPSSRLLNLTIIGDLNVAGGVIRWNNVTLNGAMNISGSTLTSIAFDGNNTINFPVSIASNSTVDFGQATAGTLTIPASRTISGGTLGFNMSGCSSAAMTVVNNGTITANTAGRTATFSSSVTLTNNGTINATPGSVTINGNITNYTGATNLLNGGTWRASGGARLAVASPFGIAVRNIGPGTLVSIDGATSSFVNSNATSVLAGLATLAGQLQLSNRAQSVTPVGGVLTNSGTLSLDRAPLTVTGAYVQTGAGTLALGVGGPALSQYGRLAASGNATLAGALSAQPTGGFVPGASDEFNAVTAAAVAGVFGLRTGGGGYSPANSYTATLAKFSFLACPTILSPLNDAVACPLGAATFTASVSGAIPLTYSWERNTPGGWVPVTDGPLSGVGTISGSSTDVLVVAVPAVPGLQFRYSVSNICGTATSGPSTLTIPVRCSLADVAGTIADATSCGDGIADGNDFIAFINSFSVGDPAIDPLADVAGAGSGNEDPDGIIDGTDFIAFINAFAAGC